MPRKLFTFAAGVSAAVCVVVAGLRLRGNFVTDQLFVQRFWDAGDRSYWHQDRILAGRGVISFTRFLQSGKRPSFRQDRARYGSSRFHSTFPPDHDDPDVVAL